MDFSRHDPQVEIIDRVRHALAGRYEVERELGQGGMAIVYLARDVRHSRPVAVKILQPQLASSVSADRFLVEIRTTARIVHPHVLPLHDSGEADGFLYYIMPYVEGESLADRLAREGALPLPEALRIAREVADGLAHAHALDVVHRDIKPANILLSSGGHACIADFGLAHAVSAVADARLTRTGTIVGSPIYMSPEQIRGTDEVDGRADVYGLGCMLYEMLTGRPPFEGYSIEEVLGRHLLESPPALDDAAVPAALEDAIRRAMAKSPADRPTAEELLALLTALEHDLGGSTPSGGAWLRAGSGRWQRRGRAAVAGVALLLALAVAWGGWRVAESGDPAVAAADSASARSAERIAVLFFDDHSPGRELGYLASGLTEGLIHELGGVEGLEVVSRNGVKPYHGAAVSLDSIARALEVGSIVEGSVTRSGDRVRVSVRLVDGRTATQLESRQVEAPVGDIFSLQDTLVQEVAQSLRQALGREIRLRQVRRGTEDPTAWELVLRARSLRDDFAAVRLTDAELGRRILVRADSALAEAARRDSEWAHPHVERGWLTRDLALLDGSLPGRLDPEGAQRALDHAGHALRLQPADATAHELRGVLRNEHARNLDAEERGALLEAAEMDLRRAVELDPQLSRAWWALSQLLSNRGEFAEARIAAERSLRADAFLENAASVLHQVYYSAVQLGPGEDAVRPCDEGRRRFPSASGFIVCQLFILASFPGVEADLDRALVLADSLVQAVPEQDRESFRSYGTMLAAEVAARAGRRDRAELLIREARGDAPVEWLAYNEAHARLLMGEPDRAVDLLSLYLSFDPDTASLARDWWFEGLRSDPRFRELIGDS